MSQIYDVYFILEVERRQEEQNQYILANTLFSLISVSLTLPPICVPQILLLTSQLHLPQNSQTLNGSNEILFKRLSLKAPFPHYE